MSADHATTRQRRPPTRTHHCPTSKRTPRRPDTRKNAICAQGNTTIDPSTEREEQMRGGSVGRRCTKRGCQSRVAVSAAKCPKCGGRSFTWSFILDLGPVEALRKQR